MLALAAGLLLLWPARSGAAPGAGAVASHASAAEPAPPRSEAAVPVKAAPIPMDQLGAVAGEQYQGDGLSVAATAEGARLRCVFQKLEGEATPEGLWLTSTTDAPHGEPFRVVARAVGRQEGGRGC